MTNLNVLTVTSLHLRDELRDSTRRVREQIKRTDEIIHRTRRVLEKVDRTLATTTQIIKCIFTGKRSHQTVEAAQGHCRDLKDNHPEHCYIWYVCGDSKPGMPHYHVATTNASTGSLIRNGHGMYSK